MYVEGSLKVFVSCRLLTPYLWKHKGYIQLWNIKDKHILNKKQTKCMSTSNWVQTFPAAMNTISLHTSLCCMWITYFACYFFCQTLWSYCISSVLHCDFICIMLARVYSTPVQPFMWCGQLQHNLVCVRATWNSIHRLKNLSAYTYEWLYLLFYPCHFLHIMFIKICILITTGNMKGMQFTTLASVCIFSKFLENKLVM